MVLPVGNSRWGVWLVILLGVGGFFGYEGSWFSVFVSKE